MGEHFIISFAYQGKQYDLDTKFVDLGDVHQYHIHVLDKTLTVEFAEKYTFHVGGQSRPSKENYKTILEAVTREIEEHNNTAKNVSAN